VNGAYRSDWPAQSLLLVLAGRAQRILGGSCSRHLASVNRSHVSLPGRPDADRPQWGALAYPDAQALGDCCEGEALADRPAGGVQLELEVCGRSSPSRSLTRGMRGCVRGRSGGRPRMRGMSSDRAPGAQRRQASARGRTRRRLRCAPRSVSRGSGACRRVWASRRSLCRPATRQRRRSPPIERRLGDLQVPQHLGEILPLVQRPFTPTDLSDGLLQRVPTSLHDRIHPLIPSAGHDEHARSLDHFTGTPSVEIFRCAMGEDEILDHGDDVLGGAGPVDPDRQRLAGVLINDVAQLEPAGQRSHRT
jgi:hypothetical protein